MGNWKFEKNISLGDVGMVVGLAVAMILAYGALKETDALHTAALEVVSEKLAMVQSDSKKTNSVASKATERIVGVETDLKILELKEAQVETDLKEVIQEFKSSLAAVEEDLDELKNIMIGLEYSYIE